MTQIIDVVAEQGTIRRLHAGDYTFIWTAPAKKSAEFEAEAVRQAAAGKIEFAVNDPKNITGTNARLATADQIAAMDILRFAPADFLAGQQTVYFHGCGWEFAKEKSVREIMDWIANGESVSWPSGIEVVAPDDDGDDNLSFGGEYSGRVKLGGTVDLAAIAAKYAR